jgi:5'(3')-deoxyribonucleotidase
MKRIAIDMDEVMADVLTEYLGRYNADFKKSFTREDLMGKHLSELAPPEHWPKIQTYFQDEAFFRNLGVMEGSQEVIEELSKQYEIFIVTAAMEIPCSFAAKYEWLRRHFPSLAPDSFVFCGNKGIIAADYLIDDSAYQLERFQGEGILFTCPRNIHETGFKRVNDWGEVRALFLENGIR